MSEFGFEMIDDLTINQIKTKTIEINEHQQQEQQEQQEAYAGQYVGQTVGVRSYKSTFAIAHDVRNDAVKLGKKTWKPSEDEKRQNLKIDAAKKLDKDATADTLDLINILKHKEDNKKVMSAAGQDPGISGFHMLALHKVHFTAKMITSTYIRNNFSYLYDTVYSYRVMKSRYDAGRLPDNDARNFERLIPLMEILSRRLTIFTKLNHVSMEKKEGENLSFEKSHVLTSKEIGDASFSKEDEREWLLMVNGEKEERKEERRAEALLATNLESPLITEKLGYSSTETESPAIEMAALLDMTKEDRLQALPEIRDRISTVSHMLSSGDGTGEEIITLRKELAELSMLEKLTTLEATWTLAIRAGEQSDAIADKLFEASEEIRKLKKRLNMQADRENETTMPAGLVFQTKQPACPGGSPLQRPCYQRSIL